MAPRIVVIGTSLGGLVALETLLGGLNRQFRVPIAVVQHRGKKSGGMLANLLQQRTPLTVKEVEDKETLEESSVYIAPADYHLLIERGYCTLSLEAPLNFARPSIDILFESAALTYGSGVIAVVLTGNNADGARGAAQVKARGGLVIVQDPDECESGAMPQSTMAAVKVDYVLKLAEIAPCLITCCQPQEEDQNGSR
jgi:two-component system chemotaxis response regulator CheB